MAKPCPLIFRTPLSCHIYPRTWSRGTLVVAAASSWFHQKYPSWSLCGLVSPRQSTPCRTHCTLCIQQTLCQLLQSCVETGRRSFQRAIRGACTLQGVVLIGNSRKRSFRQIATTWKSCVQEYHLHGRTSSSRLEIPVSMARSLERQLHPPHWCLGRTHNKSERQRKDTP